VEKIMLEGNRVYNITQNSGFSVSELIAKAEKLTGKKVPIIQGERRGMDAMYQMNAYRVFSFGWRPEWDFDTALKDYLC